MKLEAKREFTEISCKSLCNKITVNLSLEITNCQFFFPPSIGTT